MATVRTAIIACGLCWASVAAFGDVGRVGPDDVAHAAAELAADDQTALLGAEILERASAARMRVKIGKSKISSIGNFNLEKKPLRTPVLSPIRKLLCR